MNLSMPPRWRRIPIAAVLLLTTAVWAGPAAAHPHVFVTASVQFVGDGKGDLTAVRSGWVFDEMFSSSLLMDFDRNADGTLDEKELEAIGATVLHSAAAYNYFTVLKDEGKPIALAAPDKFRALIENGHLVLLTEMRPASQVALDGVDLTLSIYDPSFYVSIDVTSNDQVRLTDLPETCQSSILAEPETDGAAAWLNQVAGLGKSEKIPADGVNYAELVSSRIKLVCGKHP
ncbi:DUF1007 family protein [Mangrovicella endophytica]|uniref:DUF1007 family protein n=1 Tax=Mangrovicella endophytica TaxID=2066697 RepID=UPI0012FFED2F|nr:DUF1007 family protein [Mangrovicella endophytica]